MLIMAIDPGPTESAYVLLETPQKIITCGIVDNFDLLTSIEQRRLYAPYNAIEMVACYGMAVGQSVFDTACWIGVFSHAAKTVNIIGLWPTKIYRREVKMHLCGTMRARDANVRQALIDRYPPTGGGKTPQIGTKSEPGPLYGVRKDIWAALGVALTYVETKLVKEMKGE